jgi:hypothetical protein
MAKYRIEWTELRTHTSWVEAESESAARQAFIDEDLDEDFLVGVDTHVSDVVEEES